MRSTRSFLALVVLSLLACGDDTPLPDGPQRCEEGRFSGDALCVHGAFVSCSTLTGHCQECGCREQALCNESSGNCEPIVVGVVLGALHDSCDVHDDCGSKNCGSVAPSASTKECLVEIGTSCTDDTCQLCRSDGAASVCSRDCRDDSEPATLVTPAGATFYCIVDLITDAQLYRPACADAMPCVLSTESCWGDAVGTRFCSAKPGSEDAYCAVQSECDEDLVCNGWLERCTLPVENGDLCYGHEECASGHCAFGNCVAALPDGAACEAPADCTSERCQSGRCRKALSPLGEPCREALDCASNVCDGVCTRTVSGGACGSANECVSGLCLEHCAYSSSSPGAFSCTVLTNCSSSYCSNVCFDVALPRASSCQHAKQCADELGEASACIAEHCDRQRTYGESCTRDDQCTSGLCFGNSGCF